MNMQQRLSSVLGAVLSGFTGLVYGQNFTIAPTQIDIAVAPSFNHAPVRVAVVTNAPGLNVSNLLVSSDAAWVVPTVDPVGSKIILAFATTNLINQSYTATISASLGGQTNTLFVRAFISPLNIFKLKDDPLRSRTYGIQQNNLALGSVVVLDPVTTNYIGSVTVGRKPSDLAESADGRELFVINCVDATISVIDLTTLAVKETLTLPAFDNWGQNDTTANVAVGPSNILYYTDGAWAPALRVLNRSTMQVLQILYSQGTSGDGLGDVGISSDKRLLFGWMQYGWSAGLANSYVVRFTVAADGRLTFTDAGASQYNSMFARDPLETPVLVSSDDQTFFIKGFAVGADSASNVKYSFPTPVYSITPGGEIAVTATAVYETATGIKLADLPVNAPVQTIASDYSRFIYFDSAARALVVRSLINLIGPGFVNRDIAPADGSITLSPARLQWSPVPGVDRYHVYLGTSEAAVANADTNSPVYLGTTTQPYFQLSGPLTPGTTYFWRVDAATQFDVTRGDVRDFTVSLISSSTNEINAATVQGHRDFKTSFRLNSANPGFPWRASADQSWASFTQATGVTPATVELLLDASQLAAGLHQANVTISGSDGNALFSIPVKFRVDPLHLTIAKSDPGSVFVYAISEDASATPTRAYLLEINALTESIGRVVRVGSSATDLAVHKGDNRIYVPNWLSGALLAIDLDTFQQVRSYTFSPFGGIGYSENDIYRVSAGGPGRLVWEEEDQWIDINIFDTVGGTNIASASVRQGGGDMSGDKRYYYHGDDNSSGAEIHRFDVLGDTFRELAHVRVASVNYYGSRTVIVSEDGSRVFWNGSMFGADLVELWTIRDEIFSTSSDGRYAFSRTKIYDTGQQRAVLSMPTNTPVSAFNSTTRKLVVQTGASVAFFALTDPLTLPAPVLSAGSVTPNSVRLNWTDRSLEDGFTLQMRVAGNATWQDIATVAPNVTQFTVAGLVAQTSYAFRIKADATALSSPWSDIVTATTPASPPSTPSLNLPVATTASVSLSWSNPNDELQFVLERSVGASTNWSVLAVLAADATAYTDSNVVSLTTYFYRIKALNAGGESAYSVVRSVTVPAPAPPLAPTGLVARPVSSSAVRLAWNDGATETGYRVERRTEDPNGWSLLVMLPANTTLYVDANVLEGTQYFYRIQAFNNYGNSPYSSEAAAVPAAIVTLIEDDFDPGYDPAVWASIAGGVATNGGQGFRGSKALWFGASGVRSATTVPLDLSLGGTLEFAFRAGNEFVDGNAFWNNSETNESVAVEYSKDQGITWFPLQTLNTAYPALSNWTTFSISIPLAANAPNTQLRWRQQANSGTQFDTWALEDLSVQGAAPAPPNAPPFTTSSPASSTSITLVWIDADRASSYIIERRQGTNSWTVLATQPASKNYYTDDSVLPGTTYSYRVKAANAGGVSPYSPITTSVTRGQLEEWFFVNFGSLEGLNDEAMQAPGPDGTRPLLRFAFNLTATEPPRTLVPGQSTSGFPAIWFDPARNRLCLEFIRRKASTNPDIIYAVQFSGTLSDWNASGTETSVTSINSIWERVRYEDTVSASQSQTRFCRVAVRLQ
jgi:hypothetical protein